MDKTLFDVMPQERQMQLLKLLCKISEHGHMDNLRLANSLFFERDERTVRRAAKELERKYAKMTGPTTT